MTAIDLRASTMQILERFDKTDTSLWQKVQDAINSIYKNEEEAQQAKRAQQKAKIRRSINKARREHTKGETIKCSTPEEMQRYFDSL